MTRFAAGLVWTFDGEAWCAGDESGTYKLVEWAPGQWMDFFWRREDGCGCGAPAAGGRDWTDFETAAREVAALGR
ncbi:MAG: hypothetical protein M0006_03070 [Magnetospirillum sp.]|nr:hypothetical protein [Magnetospirillum sp.]